MPFEGETTLDLGIKDPEYLALEFENDSLVNIRTAKSDEFPDLVEEKKFRVDTITDYLLAEGACSATQIAKDTGLTNKGDTRRMCDNALWPDGLLPQIEDSAVYVPCTDCQALFTTDILHGKQLLDAHPFIDYYPSAVVDYPRIRYPSPDNGGGSLQDGGRTMEMKAIPYRQGGNGRGRSLPWNDRLNGTHNALRRGR